MKRQIIFKVLVLVFFGQAVLIDKSYSQQIVDTSKIYGLTIDDVSGVDSICTSLRRHCKKMTVRIAFDEPTAPSYYADAVDSIHNAAFTMGEIFDSWYTDSFTVADNLNKATQYVNAFANKIDIWEIGNEVNGEWLGDSDSVKAKIFSVYNMVKSRGKKTALTLFYNKPCFSIAQNEMFSWVYNYVPAAMKSGLDYVLVSYYEDSCNNYQPNWQHIFDSLHTIFPNSKLGMGECGTELETAKDSFISRYYSMNITTPKYIGGYFWWYYRHDCVPYTNQHWTTLNNAVCPPASGIQDAALPNISTVISPNPFNNTTIINFSIEKKENINLVVYDNTGRIVRILLDEVKEKGTYQIPFNATDLAEGIYLCKLSTSSEIVSKSIVLSKRQ